MAFTKKGSKGELQGHQLALRLIIPTFAVILITFVARVGLFGHLRMFSSHVGNKSYLTWSSKVKLLFLISAATAVDSSHTEKREATSRAQQYVGTTPRKTVKSSFQGLPHPSAPQNRHTGNSPSKKILSLLSLCEFLSSWQASKKFQFPFPPNLTQTLSKL